MNALEQNIMEALAGNPRVHPDEISVEALDGDVILRGTIGSVVQREEAVRTTGHVTGVKSVTDRLRLGLLLDASRRADADTEAAVLDALNADTAAGASGVDVDVRDGAVTLSGLVERVSQRDRAERDALAVPGVASVHNRLRVVFPVSGHDVAERITDAIGLNAIVGADSITVTVRGDAVTLSGTVRSRADHDTALTAAAAAPGVTDVRDEMRVMG
jgi:osmotically-inducible protein OsmY